MTPEAQKTRDAERSRAAILLAAREEFVEKGFEGARTSAIAKKAGVPQGLLYHYFESKEAMFDAVLHDGLEPYFEAQADMLEAAEADLSHQVLEDSVRAYFQYLDENPGVVRLLGWFLSSQRGQSASPLRDTPAHERLERLGDGCIRKGQEMGVIRPGLEPGFVIKMFTDLCLQWHLSRGCFYSEHGMHDMAKLGESGLDEIQQKYLDTMVEVFMNGVLVPGAASTQNGE